LGHGAIAVPANEGLVDFPHCLRKVALFPVRDRVGAIDDLDPAPSQLVTPVAGFGGVVAREPRNVVHQHGSEIARAGVLDHLVERVPLGCIRAADRVVNVLPDDVVALSLGIGSDGPPLVVNALLLLFRRAAAPWDVASRASHGHP